MTYNQMFSQLSLIWAIVALVLLIVAWRSIVRRNIKYHRGLMIFLTLGAWVFIAAYMLNYRSPDRPVVAPEYIPWLAIHGTIGLFILIGASLLVWARLRQARDSQAFLYLNRHHKRYGRILIVLWVFTHIGGIVNYWLFY